VLHYLEMENSLQTMFRIKYKTDKLDYICSIHARRNWALADNWTYQFILIF